MRLRNLTHSPYPVPTKDGTEKIIPAFGVEDVDLQDGYHLDDAFWRVESAEDQAPEPDDKDKDESSDEDNEDDSSEEDDSEDDEGSSEETDEEADASGDEEVPEAPQPVQRPVLSARKKGRRR